MAQSHITVRTHNPNEGLVLSQRSLRPADEAGGGGGGGASTAFVCVGDVIETDDQDGFLRGHGTQVVDGRLVATLCGVVERVNKLVSVRPLRARYSAQLGDVVVGRVVEVAGRRWKVDLNSRQEAGLLLSAVSLPGGVQRRRNAEDELAMRDVLREGDLVSAEVQALHNDGSVMLHTRSAKYGKLARGQLVVVPANLVRRQKQHFVTLGAVDPPVALILGLNGLIWVAPAVADADGDGDANTAAAAVAQQQQQPSSAPATLAVGGAADAGFARAQRGAACRVANAVRALAALYLQVYPATIADAYELSVQHGVEAKAMLEAPFLELVAQSEAVRRHAEAVAAE